MREFCPKCGTEKGPFVKGFCLNCFSAEQELAELPEEIPLEYCGRCNKFKYKNKFIEFNDAMLTDLILSKLKPKEASIDSVKINFVEVTEGKKLAVVEIEGTVDGKKISFDKKSVIKFRAGICDACMKASSNYFEATLQLRFDSLPDNAKKNKVMAEVYEFLAPMEKIDPLAKVIDIERDKKGFDLKIGSKKAAKDLADFLARKSKSRVIPSHKVVGVKNGEQKKRFTFCVRM